MPPPYLRAVVGGAVASFAAGLGVVIDLFRTLRPRARRRASHRAQGGESSGRSPSRVGRVVSTVVGSLALALSFLPYVLATRQASNETSAMASLITYTSGQETFRKTDFYGIGKHVFANQRDGAGYADLHSLTRASDGSKQIIKLIDLSMASANPRTAGPPRSGYYFADITGDARGPYDYTRSHALCAYPARYRYSGFGTFIVDVSGHVYQKDTRGSPVKVWPDIEKDGWTAVGGR